jgi:hypothetical protein
MGKTPWLQGFYAVCCGKRVLWGGRIDGINFGQWFCKNNTTLWYKGKLLVGLNRDVGRHCGTNKGWKRQK